MSDSPTKDELLAEFLTDALFDIGSEPDDLATRIEFKLGPLLEERAGGGFARTPLETFLAKRIKDFREQYG